MSHKKHRSQWLHNAVDRIVDREPSPMQTLTDLPIRSPPPQVIITVHNEREWTYGMLNCLEDVEETIWAFFCPLLYSYTITKRANEPCYSCLVAGPVPVRTKVRVQRKIKGSVTGDFCSFVFCPCCMLVQTGREAKDTDTII